MQLNPNAKLVIHDLHSKYKDSNDLDKSIQALSTLDSVTGIVKQGISKIIDNR